MQIRAIHFLALAVLLAVSACGRGAGEVFLEEELGPLDRRLEQGKSRLSATLSTVELGNRADARRIADQVEAVETSLRRIAKLRPPADARDEFVRYTRANSELVRLLRRFADALAARRSKQLERVGQQARDTAGRVSRARRALEDALSGG